MNTFETLESNVRSYCRSFPVVFNKAKNDVMYTEAGEGYIDFFAGAGALNYGHNNDFMKNRLLDYLTSDRIMHGLDMYTTAKQEFIESFSERILRPKGLNYKLQFCGPTGTNAVEAALKLARKVKKEMVFLLLWARSTVCRSVVYRLPAITPCERAQESH